MDFRTDKIALIKMLRQIYSEIREIVLRNEMEERNEGWAPKGLGLKEAKDIVENYEFRQLALEDPKLRLLRELQEQIEGAKHTMRQVQAELNPQQSAAWSRVVRHD